MNETAMPSGCCAGMDMAAAAAACCPPGAGKGTDPSSRCGPASEPASTDAPRTDERKLEIDLMYLDLSVCERCQGAEASLAEAVEEVGRVLAAIDVDIAVNKVHVTGEDQARELGFLVSPTIRIDGRDIQMDFRESRCDTCGTLCDCEGGVSCREWGYQGQWYTSPPKGLIVEAILKAVFGSAKPDQAGPAEPGDVPDNLKRFFAGKTH